MKLIPGIVTLKSSLQEALICLYGTDVAVKIYELFNIHLYGNSEEVIHREYPWILFNSGLIKHTLNHQKYEFWTSPGQIVCAETGSFLIVPSLTLDLNVKIGDSELSAEEQIWTTYFVILCKKNYLMVRCQKISIKPVVV